MKKSGCTFLALLGSLSFFASCDLLLPRTLPNSSQAYEVLESVSSTIVSAEKGYVAYSDYRAGTGRNVVAKLNLGTGEVSDIWEGSIQPFGIWSLDGMFYIAASESLSYVLADSSGKNFLSPYIPTAFAPAPEPTAKTRLIPTDGSIASGSERGYRDGYFYWGLRPGESTPGVVRPPSERWQIVRAAAIPKIGSLPQIVFQGPTGIWDSVKFYTGAESLYVIERLADSKEVVLYAVDYSSLKSRVLLKVSSPTDPSSAFYETTANIFLSTNGKIYRLPKSLGDVTIVPVPETETYTPTSPWDAGVADTRLYGLRAYGAQLAILTQRSIYLWDDSQGFSKIYARNDGDTNFTPEYRYFFWIRNGEITFYQAGGFDRADNKFIQFYRLDRTAQKLVPTQQLWIPEFQGIVVWDFHLDYLMAYSKGSFYLIDKVTGQLTEKKYASELRVYDPVTNMVFWADSTGVWRQSAATPVTPILLVDPKAEAGGSGYLQSADQCGDRFIWLSELYNNKGKISRISVTEDRFATQRILEQMIVAQTDVTQQLYPKKVFLGEKHYAVYRQHSYQNNSALDLHDLTTGAKIRDLTQVGFEKSPYDFTGRGDLVFSADSKGLHSFDTASGVVFHIDSSGTVNSIYVDQNHVYWSSSHGIDRAPLSGGKSERLYQEECYRLTGDETHIFAVSGHKIIKIAK